MLFMFIIEGNVHMKKTFKLEGLGCANCANKIQDRIGKLDGVDSATVNFVTTKLTIEGDGSKMDGIIVAAGAIVKKLEPDVVMHKA